MINSISLEKKRLEKLLPILSNTDFKVVALCTSDDCVPETTEQRLKIADKLINRLVQNNISLENIFLDPLVQPISTNTVFGIEFLKAIQAIMNRYPGVHTMCGLSNISFGLPLRKKLNQSFLTAAITMGMDGAIINPLDQQMMANIACAEALVGKDIYCENYLKAFRSGILEK
jgi:5-methyltetrahydrofolate--homocysteine methyltransferase